MNGKNEWLMAKVDKNLVFGSNWEENYGVGVDLWRCGRMRFGGLAGIL